jgi:hypothetical protein
VAKKVADVAGGVAGGNWSRGKVSEAKSVWVYELAVATSQDGAERQEKASERSTS